VRQVASHTNDSPPLPRARDEKGQRLSTTLGSVIDSSAAAERSRNKCFSKASDRGFRPLRNNHLHAVILRGFWNV